MQGQFSLVDPAVDVPAPLFCQRPLERAPRLVGKERAKRAGRDGRGRRVGAVAGLAIIAVVSRGLRGENVGDVALGLIRTRADLHRWGAANAHGRQMHEAVGLLRGAAESADPAVLLAVVEKAVAAAVRVILRADDSSGIIGDAIRSLLELHANVASKAALLPRKARISTARRCLTRLTAALLE